MFSFFKKKNSATQDTIVRNAEIQFVVKLRRLDEAPSAPYDYCINVSAISPSEAENKAKLLVAQNGYWSVSSTTNQRTSLLETVSVEQL